MPKYVETNTPYTHHIDFIVDGELVIPTSASFTLSKNDGSIINSYEDEEIVLGSGDTWANIDLLAEDNVSTLSHEIRYLDVKFSYNSKDYLISDYYFLKPSIKFPVSKNDIRAVLGLSDTELPDEYIDIFSAIYLVQADVGDTPDIQGLVSNGDIKLPYVLEAVKLKAASQFMTSIQSLTMQMEQADNTLYRRFAQIDFKAMSNDLATKYAIALQQIREESAQVIPVLSILAQGTDAVTGE